MHDCVPRGRLTCLPWCKPGLRVRVSRERAAGPRDTVTREAAAAALRFGAGERESCGSDHPFISYLLISMPATDCDTDLVRLASSCVLVNTGDVHFENIEACGCGVFPLITYYYY
jgi:hypothetical protein